MLLAIVMVFGFAAPAMAEQIEEPGFYAPAGSVQSKKIPGGILLYVTAPECDCGTDCGAHLEVTREYISGFGTMYFLRWLIITQEMLFITTTG